MTSIKVKFRPSAVAGREGTIYIQLIHNRRVRLIATRFKLMHWEWDDRLSSVVIQTLDSKRADYLYSIRQSIASEVVNLEGVVSAIRGQGEYSVDHVVGYYKTQAMNGYLFTFGQYQRDMLKASGQTKTAAAYTTALRSFAGFRNGQDIHFSRIDGAVMKRYEMYLKQRNVSKNSISCYMRTLRSIYNKALFCGLVNGGYNPFAQVYTGIAKTVKRAVSQDIIVAMMALDLLEGGNLAFPRDLFLFSFYTRGMSFVDMSKLKRENIKNGVLTYRRSKTKQLLSVKLEPCILAIIEKYALRVVGSNYLLPILTNKGQSYDSALRNYNKQLADISTILGLCKPLSSYVSRHSWATLAANKGVPIQVISQGMGHENEKTTRIYLDSMDQSLLDNANALVISL